jgi:hypothetical protein
MKTIIATVQKIEGTFYAKDASGNIIELHEGDSVSSDVLVYGDKANPSSANISLEILDNNEVINISGTIEQQLDDSFVDDILDIEGLALENLQMALDQTIYIDEAQADIEDEEDIANLDETAAGEEQPVTGQTKEDVFTARDGESVDVVSGLRSAEFTLASRPEIEEPQLFEVDGLTPNDGTPPDAGATVSITGDAAVWEGNTATYTVTTDTISTSPISVVVQTTNATVNPATSDVDYTTVNQTVIIPANKKSATFTVQTLDDAQADSGENFVAG